MSTRRFRISCAAMMATVALCAVVFNHFRPVGRDEAIKIGVRYLKTNFPAGRWSSKQASARVAPMGGMWVVGVADGQPRLDDHFFDNIAIVLVYFDGRCFRQGVDFSGLGGSVEGFLDDETGEWWVNYDYVGESIHGDEFVRRMEKRIISGR